MPSENSSVDRSAHAWKTGASPRLWDYGMAHKAKILSLIARGPEGRTPHEAVVHETPDISEYLNFNFYDPIWYLDRPSSPDNVKIGRWLGVAHRIGSSLCYWILTATGKVIARTTVQHVTQEDLSDTQKKAQLESFDNSVRDFLDDESHRVTLQDNI